jgi:hypothetical protein
LRELLNRPGVMIAVATFVIQSSYRPHFRGRGVRTDPSLCGQRGRPHACYDDSGRVARDGASEGIRIMAKIFLISLSIWYLMCYRTSV